MRAKKALLLLPLLVALGCSSAFAEALERGDLLARRGSWDQAAAEYERALALDPGNEEARQKLWMARRSQSSERVQRARALLYQQGDAPGAMALAQQAVMFDPSSAPARQILAEAIARTLDRADQLLAAGDARDALELTTLVIRVAPVDQRARSLDARAREQIAAAAHARAEAFAGQGRLGNALLELAAANTVVPGYRGAPARMGELRRALREQVTFTAIVPPFTGDEGSADLAAGVGADRLRQAFDPALPIVVRAEGQEGEEAAAVIGVRLRGGFSGYSFRHDEASAPRSCMYVCGWSTVSNPEHAAASGDLEQARARLPGAEGEVDRARHEVSRYERDVDDAKRAVERAKIDVDRARVDLDRCLAKPVPAPPPEKPAPSPDRDRCSAEQSALDRATERLRAEEGRLATPEGQLSAARARLATAEGRLAVIREDIAEAARRLDRTPRTIQVARKCSHGYLAELHAVHAAVTVTVSAESLHDGAALFDRDARLVEQRAEDETFPAQPGRCDEVAEGDPLTLPAEVELKHALLTQAVGGVRDRILFAYDRYRQQLLTSADREQAAGAVDEAVERYARWLLLGRAGQDERARVLAYVAAAKGITPAAAAGAL